ncbi:hypothetical protein [Streptomyces sp. NPDC007369]|uniref:hypothetical protein n=1 Tax=Streptomyces sp. NPDC007369 TaxID=3154589 RepID=UPI00340B3D45
MQQRESFTEQAGVAYAAVGRGKRVHYSPRNDETLCGRAITTYLDAEDAVARFDKGHELCTPCHRAAEQRAEARRLADASPLAAAAVALADTVEQADAERAAGPNVHRFDSTREAYDATQCREDILDGDVLVIEREQVVGFLRSAWPGAITAMHGELHTFTADPRTIDDGKYAASVDLAEQVARELGAPIAGEQRAVEGVVVEHAGVAEGSRPSHVAHPDVVAARAVLSNLKPAAVTEHTEITEPDEADPTVRGYLVEPRGNGRVAAYWLEGGLITSRRDAVNGDVPLTIVADKFRAAGWTVESQSLRCVFAWRPAEAEPVPGALVDPWTWLRRPANSHRTRRAEPAAAEALACVHRVTPRADVSGAPIKACARKQPNQEAGVFNDEGCVEAFDCAVQAANRAAEMNVEEDAPAGDPLYMWDLLCVEHRDAEQQVDTCEECNAEPAEGRCPECSGKGCHWCYWTGERQPEQVEQPEAVEHDVVAEDEVEAAGTWREGWIARRPAAVDEGLFELDPEAEQGALFE